MNKKLVLIILTISLVLSACNSKVVSVRLPHNNCGVTACQTTDNGSVSIMGHQITK